MGTYSITSKYFSDEIDLHIVQNLSGGGGQGVIIYEGVGSNGGIAISTGRLNESLSIGGKILSKFKYPTQIDIIQDDVNNKASQLADIRDLGVPININGSLPTNKTGEYLIAEFLWSKAEGQRKYVGFTMTLREHRQVNIKRNSVNLIGSQAVAESMIARKNARSLS